MHAQKHNACNPAPTRRCTSICQKATGKRRCRTSCRTWTSLPRQPAPLRRLDRCRPLPPPAPLTCRTCSTAPQRSDLRRSLASACTSHPSCVPAGCRGVWPRCPCPSGPRHACGHDSLGNMPRITPGTATVLEWATRGGPRRAVQPLAWSKGRVRAGGAGHRLSGGHLHQLREAPGRLTVRSTEPSLCFTCPLSSLTQSFVGTLPIRRLAMCCRMQSSAGMCFTLICALFDVRDAWRSSTCTELGCCCGQVLVRIVFSLCVCFPRLLSRQRRMIA